MDYLIVTQAAGYPVSPTKFATESAFAEHLRLLRKKTKHDFDKMVVAMPLLSEVTYQANKKHLAEIETTEEIIFLPLHPQDISFVKFWYQHFFNIKKRLSGQIKKTKIVHSGLSTDIWRPTSFISIYLAWRLKKKTLYFVDIDNRKSAWMNYQTGTWSLKSYLLCRYVYDKLRSAQIKFAVKRCALVMLKSAKLVRDYGKGQPHVKNFFDTVHSTEHILNKDKLEQKCTYLHDTNHPINFGFFGRLVAYKGLDRCIKALHLALQKTKRPFKFHIIGTGEEDETLKILVKDLKLEEHVIFHPPVPYGTELFQKIYDLGIDILLAAPLREDTPRSAFDSFAAGVPILAYDIAYYDDLKDTSGAVITSPWPNVEKMAETMITCDQNRQKLIKMTRAAVEFAHQNTQDIWLDRRVKWTKAICEDESLSDIS
ncbi:MAG: glycosyltransferase [Pseudomonadota bacterium]